MQKNTSREFRWYFAGFAGSVAIAAVHPIDLLKVHMQTQQERKFGIFRFAQMAIARDGFRSLFRGLSAAIVRQLTYTSIRIGFYQEIRQYLSREQHYEPNFPAKVALAGMCGIAGVLVGNPFDVITIRMQNDVKLPSNERRK
jgi:solute carrier family 25 (mitochondrial dicarboxylate transporter), member 10